MATLCSTADANVDTSAMTIQLSVVLWAQIALSPSRAARDQHSTFDVQLQRWVCCHLFLAAAGVRQGMFHRQPHATSSLSRQSRVQ